MRILNSLFKKYVFKLCLIDLPILLEKTTEPLENLPKAITIVTSMLKTGDLAITSDTETDGDKS